MNNQISKEEKKRTLLQSQEKALERLRKVQKRMREEEEDSEEIWPGHDSTRYHLKITEYETLLAYLKEIGEELKKLGR
ncbi:hypothetical protein A2Z41_03720 [Microgenomates group bacterium RBG_19FT_COMBO_39_10]|nr:MAG: hypothetical protein A2Z41_03720 [Microgenomates group bacterium RBG_19FT_COMBO_39_10]